MTQDAEETGCGAGSTLNSCTLAGNASWRFPHCTVCAGCSKVVLQPAPQQLVNVLFAHRKHFVLLHGFSGTPVSGFTGCAAMVMKMVEPKDAKKQ